jgi:hypothetical protein
MQWRTPMFRRDAETTQDDPLMLAETPLGQGRIKLCGTYLGGANLEATGERAHAFEEFLVALATGAGVQRPATVLAPAFNGDDFVHVRVGAARVDDGAPRPMAFVFSPDPEATVEVRFAPAIFGAEVTDLLSCQTFPLTPCDGGQCVTLSALTWGIAVLVG